MGGKKEGGEERGNCESISVLLSQWLSFKLTIGESLSMHITSIPTS